MSTPPESDRREFLQLKALRDRAAQHEPTPSPNAGEGHYLLQFERSAMACRFALYLNAGEYPDGTDSALRALDLVEQLEAQLTVYRDSSALSLINQLAAHEPIDVEPRLFALLQQSLDLHRDTHGAFDITAGPLTKLWGFYRRQGAVPDPDALRQALDCVGSSAIELDASQHTIRFRRPGVELNLGSIGKGYALDRCAELLQSEGLENFMWHGGNSSVLARGCNASRGAGRGWSVGVSDPLQSELRLGEIQLVDQALATSGASVQFFRYRGKRYGHILDPRTGWPAEGVFSSTVVAPTAAEADALATAFYVMGVDATIEYCRAHPSIGAVLAYPSSQGSKVELAICGLSSAQWTPLRRT